MAINQILQRHEIHTISQPVTDIESQVLPHIERMKSLCNQRIGNYQGAVALAHCQIERYNPLTFFVFKDGEAIVNPITEGIPPISDRFTHLEGCLSLALRPQKRVQRYDNMMVSYVSVLSELIEGKINYMIKHRIRVTELGLRACVFQHEMDHFRNKYIY